MKNFYGISVAALTAMVLVVGGRVINCRWILKLLAIVILSSGCSGVVKLSDYYAVNNTKTLIGKKKYTEVFLKQPQGSQYKVIGTIENPQGILAGELTSLKMSNFAISIDGKSILYWHKKVSLFGPNKDEGIYWHQIANGETLLYSDDELGRFWTRYYKPLPENVMVIRDASINTSLKRSRSDEMILYADDGLLKPLGLYGGNELHKAVYENKIKRVKELIENGIDIDELTYWNYSPLNIAVKKGFSEIAIYLIERGASYKTDISNRVFGNPFSVIGNAVFLQRFGVIKAIQDKGTKLDDPVLFLKAVLRNHSGLIEDDLNNVNIESIPKIIRLLIKDGGNPNADGLGIIIKLVKNKWLHGSQGQLEVLTLLLEHGVDPIALDTGAKYYGDRAKDWNNGTALHLISGSRFWDINKEGTRKVIGLIAKYSAHLETKNRFGITALQECMLRLDKAWRPPSNTYKMALYLIELGADDSVEYLSGVMRRKTGVSIRNKITEMEAVLSENPIHGTLH